MANKRDFKKSVDAVGAAVCNEMMTTYYNVEGADKEAIADAIQKVLGAVVNAKNNANIFFDKGVKAFADIQEYSKSKKVFFKALFFKIHSEFGAVINEALKQFNNAIPEEVKKANKESAK